MQRIIGLVVAAGVSIVTATLGHHEVVFAQEPSSPPGSKIVFSSTQHVVPEPPPSLNQDPRVQLYIMNPDGSDQRQLTDFPGFKIGAVCSPNGKQIAFHAGQTPFDSRPSIFLMDVDTFIDPTGAGLTKLVSGGLFPAWSPNGKKIAFQSPPPRRDIFVVDVDTLELTNLTNDPNTTSDDAWDDFRPAWSPNGQQIAFTSNRDGIPEIYVMNADGANPTRLTFSNGAASNEAVWSPNGQEIVFTSNRDWFLTYPDLENGPGSELYIMNADGSDIRRLTDDVARDRDAAFSPNGRQIVFESDRVVQFTLQVYVMNADGSEQTQLTGAPLPGGRGESSHAGWCAGRAPKP